MAAYKEMKPEEVRKALEGHVNILSDALDREKSSLQNAQCPKCRSHSLDVSVDAKRPFTPGSILSNKVAKCLECEVEFNLTPS